MTKAMLASIREATQILQTSGPAEATAAIQRAMQGTVRSGAEGHERMRSWPSRPALPSGPSRPPRVARHTRETRSDLPGGRFLSGSFANAAGSRAYKIYVPTGYQGQALPLVVMLHGCTQTPDDFAAGTRMNAAAELKPCFVLYPAQDQHSNSGRCWNWFKRGHQHRDRGEPSIIADMTRELIGKYDIDPRRAYVAGLSSGGAMAGVMGATYPDLYAAVGVHSGLPYGAAHDLPSALQAMKGQGETPAARSRRAGIPVIVFHGDADATVHPSNGDEVVLQCLPEDGASASAPKKVVQRGQPPNGYFFTRTLHHDDAGRVVAEHWVVHGGIHGWSGGSREGSHVDPDGPDATREMLRFFSEWGQPA
ncbi:MAG TPA: PHB depolymerase family esterase [Myxococcaceae bacterium]